MGERLAGLCVTILGLIGGVFFIYMPVSAAMEGGDVHVSLKGVIISVFLVAIGLLTMIIGEPKSISLTSLAWKIRTGVLCTIAIGSCVGVCIWMINIFHAHGYTF